MNCKDCKHSAKDDDYSLETVDKKPLLVCLSDRWKQGYRIAPIADGEVLVENDEGWAFRVSQMFGCVHFEPRTK